MSREDFKDWRGYVLSFLTAAVLSFLWMHLTMGSSIAQKEDVTALRHEIQELTGEVTGIDRRLSRMEGRYAVE